MPKKSTSQFITESIAIHGNAYGYELCDYKGAKSKVTLICKKHGEFEQEASGHLSGKGCFRCAGENRGKIMASKFADKFKERAIAVHGVVYDYSDVKYKTARVKVKILCKVHGAFLMAPYRHLSGSGCPKCAGKDKDTSEFVRQAKKIHGSKYSYKNTEYKSAHEKVIITCKKHGDFKQTPSNHLHKKGYGCYMCCESKGERIVAKWLTVLGWDFVRQKQIYTSKNRHPQMLDFFIPEINVAIEYNGRQHYKKLSFFGGEEGYSKIVERDNKKRMFCEKHNISLVEIPFTKINEIRSILLKKIGSKKTKPDTKTMLMQPVSAYISY